MDKFSLNSYKTVIYISFEKNNSVCFVNSKTKVFVFLDKLMIHNKEHHCNGFFCVRIIHIKNLTYINEKKVGYIVFKNVPSFNCDLSIVQ